jgi:hypothetical protein
VPLEATTSKSAVASKQTRRRLLSPIPYLPLLRFPLTNNNINHPQHTTKQIIPSSTQFHPTNNIPPTMNFTTSTILAMIAAITTATSNIRANPSTTVDPQGIAPFPSDDRKSFPLLSHEASHC